MAPEAMNYESKTFQQTKHENARLKIEASRTFKNIHRGQRVYFRLPDGTETWSFPNPLLIFDTHVVVKRGMFGTVVDERNFIRVGGAPR